MSLDDVLAARALWVGVGIGSVVMFVGTLLAVPRLVARLPVDYFVGSSPPARAGSKRPMLTFFARLLRNALGLGFVLAGVAMLVLPGQGILTLLIGIALTDFPGKRRLERRIVRQRHIRKSLQWLRRRAEVEPLAFEHEASEASEPDPR